MLDSGTSGWNRVNSLSGKADEWKKYWRRCGQPKKSVETATGPFARTSEMARLEAVLFILGEPLSSRKLAQLANLADGAEARKLVAALNDNYDAAKCAFRVEEIAGGFQLFTREADGKWERRRRGLSPRTAGAREVSNEEMGLSAPAMETMCVVAYEQPITRAGIEAIRGVKCGELLRQLMDRQLIRITGRSKELGRPVLYGTTQRFLAMLGLRNLEDLPRWNEFRGSTPPEAASSRDASKRSRRPTDQ